MAAAPPGSLESALQHKVLFAVCLPVQLFKASCMLDILSCTSREGQKFVTKLGRFSLFAMHHAV